MLYSIRISSTWEVYGAVGDFDQIAGFDARGVLCGNLVFERGRNKDIAIAVDGFDVARLFLGANEGLGMSKPSGR